MNEEKPQQKKEGEADPPLSTEEIERNVEDWIENEVIPHPRHQSWRGSGLPRRRNTRS